jgi:hypothetical protein
MVVNDKKGSALAALLHQTGPSNSRTPRRAPTRIALEARAIAHQGEVAAFAAHLALVALGPRFGRALGGVGLGIGLGPRQGVERLRGGELALRLLA